MKFILFYFNILFLLIPGTVIDTNIVLSNGFEFYLNSHSTTKDTSRPTFYQVWLNEINFTSDDIQALTYVSSL